VIEALRTSILVPHDHLHIKHERLMTVPEQGIAAGRRSASTL